MTISFPKKPRKEGIGFWTDGSGEVFSVGKDWALQNEINEKKELTKSRGCYVDCRTCGSCGNSRRDNLNTQVFVTEGNKVILKAPTMSYDSVRKTWIDCRACEPFRYHDCHNGFFRDFHGEAEPFTPDVVELLRTTGGKPLI